jgi:formylglycine-generating enzyme required for sulfatase activity
MADIFVSYSREDEERVKLLVNALEREGWTVWWDRKTVAGDVFDMTIQRELESSRCVVVVWSIDSVKSHWVREEAGTGREMNVLIPVRIDAVTLPLGFKLIQAVDLVGWTGYSTNAEYQHLVQSIQGKIGAAKPQSARTKVKKVDRSTVAKAKSENPKQERSIIEPTPVTRKIRLPERTEIEFEMVDLPRGKFQMGSTENAEEQPVHSVKVAPFSIGKYQVTQAQWRAVMGNNPSRFKGDTRPVEMVSWFEAKEFCRRLSEMTSFNFRLPTEAEWEYAARAGTRTRWSFGDDEEKLGEYAWYGGNAGNETHPVGQKKPNGYGLYDMHGNVWEWVEDHWHGGYIEAPRNGRAWLTGDDNARRVLRGGSWNLFNVVTRSAVRNLNRPNNHDSFIGFRVVVGAQTQR